MVKEAIILAGGLGTRLRSVVSDVPKCMAPVNAIPFIHFIVEYLKNEGVKKFIFSLGYKHEMITSYLDDKFPGLEKSYSIEQEQLGTGGAIQLACSHVSGDNVIVLNGDTLFNINISSISNIHIEQKADCTIALKPMKNFDRYGSVEMNGNNRITSFNEKKFCREGVINGGVYIIRKSSLLNKQLPPVFSFEKDYLEKFIAVDNITGVIKDFYFIDIGIPEDYRRFVNDYRSSNIEEANEKENAIGALGDFFQWIGNLIH
jgi:D-glycero-alpha-D-manno-heptose 1-phosphate guanylyltransferase